MIPQTVRRKLRLKEGMRFLVIGIGDTIVLRMLELSEERKKLRNLLRKSRNKAAKVGFTEGEIERFVHESRKVV